MLSFSKKLVHSLPVISRLKEREKALADRQAELERRESELNSLQSELEMRKRDLDARGDPRIGISERFCRDSIDSNPWAHPYLTNLNLRRFKEYSEEVWRFAEEYRGTRPAPLNIGFCVNLAQNMYKWACLAKKYGARCTLFLNPMDGSALSRPEWEEFDGEYPDIMDGQGFLRATPHLQPEVPWECLPMNGSELIKAFQEFYEGNRKPLLAIMSKNPGLRHEILVSYNGFYPYYSWVRSLSRFDVLYTTSSALPAYASGRPYCAFSCGADLQFDAGRGDDYGRVSLLAFNAARFLLITNPHTLGHCRRLGLRNGVYLPYPMDDMRYCPGEGTSRAEWEQRYGRGIFVLMASRLDPEVKGQDEGFFKGLMEASQKNPELRFIFLNWGTKADDLRQKMAQADIGTRFLVFPPVGKKRLIDYYRSCDVVLDQFVYGYYGAAGLEAAAVGKPVILKLRAEQYNPLYGGDVMPAIPASNGAEIGMALLELAGNKEYRMEQGRKMRDWLVRNHGERRTIPLLLALLRVAADRVGLPAELKNPLWEEETEEEIGYHQACLQGAVER